MRKNLTNPDLHFMKYQIREVVEVAKKIHDLDPTIKIVWENIGDPVKQAWPVPKFLKEIIIDQVGQEGDKAFAYSHSRGLPETRQWVVDHVKKLCPTSELDSEYVLFTSGLGAAISSIYQMMPKGARVLQPSPGYPAHASMESFNAQADPIFYNLDFKNDWQPDLEHMENQIKNNSDIAGILVINPNNPTGTVYTRETLEKIVDLAEKYNLFIISDEVYFRMVYNGKHHVQIVDLAHNRIPVMVMRGVSKDVPWPGGRCGWIEFHGVKLDEEYMALAEAIKKRVLMEVCSTSLPQYIVPAIYDHPEFFGWIEKYNQGLQDNGNKIAEILGNTKGLTVNRTDGAFYMMPMFEEGVLNDKQTLEIENEAVRQFVEESVNKPNFPLDQRFTYYLLGAEGICVVPATGFFSNFNGFRLTTLDRDEERSKDTYERLSRAVERYIASA